MTDLMKRLKRMGIGKHPFGYLAKEAFDCIEKLQEELENERHEMNGLEDDYGELESRNKAGLKRLRQAMKDGEIATPAYYEIRKALGGRQ